MKRISILILTALCIVGSAGAAPFTFRNSDLPDLIAALRSLDGYEKAVDQGPGNGFRVIRQPYTFAREVRAKLGADLTVLQDAAKTFNDELSKLRLEISGNPQAIDEKDPIQVKLWNRRAPELLAKTVTLDLSPVSNDDLKPGSAEGENPIPISVLAILNALRPPQNKP